MLDLRGYGWMLWQGLEPTILVGLGAMTLALVLGLLGAWGKLSRARTGRWIAGTHTTVVRGVPELILILLVYYGVPTLVQDLAAAPGLILIVVLSAGRICTEPRLLPTPASRPRSRGRNPLKNPAPACASEPMRNRKSTSRHPDRGSEGVDVSSGDFGFCKLRFSLHVGAPHGSPAGCKPACIVGGNCPACRNPAPSNPGTFERQAHPCHPFP